MAYSAINQQINVWDGKLILKIGFIKVFEINTNSNIVVIFGNKNNISQLLWILNHRYKTNTELLQNLIFHMQTPTLMQSP